MPQKKFRVLTDSACDMPYDMAEANQIDIMNFGITVAGVPYVEREDFNFDEYYAMLRKCERVPSTAHITMNRFSEKLEQYHGEGVEALLCVCINATGSATYDAACMAAKKFRAQHLGSPMEMYIVDSHCYSMAYGWFVAEAAKRLSSGEPMPKVVAWLNDVFTKVEILLAAYSLRFMKKSGRISAAAAIAGEILGVRPIITLNDGISVVERKVRGDREVLPAMVTYASEHRRSPLYMVGSTALPAVNDLGAMCAKAWGTPPLCTFKLGAAVATNTGPDAIAIVYVGAARRSPDRTEPI